MAEGSSASSLTPERCDQLQLPMMVQTIVAAGTAFTVSIEASTGVTTGISVADRAHTVRVAVAPNAKPQDLSKPGHIFPLRARAGGVLFAPVRPKGRSTWRDWLVLSRPA